MLIRQSFISVYLQSLLGVAVCLSFDIYNGGRPYWVGLLTYWVGLLIFVVPYACLVRLIPMGKLTKESFTGLDTWCRLRTIKWTAVNRCVFYNWLGLVGVRLYVENSRAAVWLLLPGPSRTRIEEFILCNTPWSFPAQALQKHRENPRIKHFERSSFCRERSRS
jgi:hypothetical protein